MSFTGPSSVSAAFVWSLRSWAELVRRDCSLRAAFGPTAGLRRYLREASAGRAAKRTMAIAGSIAGWCRRGRTRGEPGAVGGAAAVGVEAQSGLDAGDGAVGVDVPLLVVLVVAVPDDDGGAVGGAASAGVEALVAVDDQLLARGVGPGLAGGAVAVPELGRGAVGGGRAWSRSDSSGTDELLDPAAVD